MTAISGKRPKAVDLATALLCVVFAIGLVLMSGRVIHKVPFVPPSVIYVLFAFVFALMATMVYFVFHGHNWAKLTCVLLIGIRTVTAVSRATSEFAHSPTGPAIIVLASVELFAAYLLLSKASNAWFKRLGP